jgi:HEAT repeat protein
MGRGLVQNTAVVRGLGALLGEGVDVSLRAADVLCSLGETVAKDPDVVKSIVAMLGADASDDVRSAATEALCLMGEGLAQNEDVVGRLVAMLGPDASDDVRSAAATVFGSMGETMIKDPAVVKGVLAMLGLNGKMSRAAAVTIRHWGRYTLVKHPGLA